MSEIKNGTVTVVIPDAVSIPPEAGNLSRKERQRLPNARHGLGSASSRTAAELEKAGDSFSVPGVDAQTLRQQAEQADLIDEVIQDAEFTLRLLKQADVIIDAKTYEMLRRVRAHVKAQSAFDPSLNERFSSVIEYFSHTKKAKTQPRPQTEV